MHLPVHVEVGEFHTLPTMVRGDKLTIRMHSSLQIRVVTRESNGVVSSLWILSCSSRLLCIFIVVLEAHLQREALTMSHNTFFNHSWLPSLEDLAPICRPPTYLSGLQN